jgi:hypothetical protein
MSAVAPRKRLPGTLAERFWSLAHSVGEESTDPEPTAVVRHVLKILDSLEAGEVGDGVSQCSLSFLALLRQHEAMGDLSYASPEQARGENIDERSLVFSVGVLLFEELTGRHPFGKETARRFARIKKGELGSGVQYFPQVPTELRTVLVRAMGPFPEERFASLAELRRVLEKFVAAPKDEVGDNERTRHFRRPVMLAPGISLPADAFTPTTPSPTPSKGVAAAVSPTPPKGVQAAVSPTPPKGVQAASTPPLPMPRPIPSPLMSTPIMPPVARKRRRLSAALERAGWLALGALVTVGALKLPSLFRHAPPPAAAVAPVVSPLAPEPSVLEPPTPAKVVEAASAAPAQFDVEAAAHAGAEASRKCFDKIDHTISFGAGLLFAPDGPGAHRAFLSPDDPLSPDARRCIAKAFVGASAGAAPQARVIIEARFKLRPDGTDDIKIK